MAYIYHIGFNIHPEQMTELEIGASLERALGYLRTLLPSEIGFISARAMFSLDQADRVHLVFESTWDQWRDLQAHQASEVAENKVLTEFEPHVELQDLSVRIYEEVT